MAAIFLTSVSSTAESLTALDICEQGAFGDRREGSHEIQVVKLGKAKQGVDSAVRSAANALRAIVFEMKDGEFVGTEDEMALRLCVSKPTLRQAAGLVAQERWLRVKRGVKGGYFACRPTSGAVAHMAATYLHAHGASVEEIIRAVRPIRVELARLAAKNLDDRSREQLEAFLAEEAKVDEQDFRYRSFLKSERAFGEVLGRASGNQVLALFMKISYDMAALIPREQDLYAGHPERVQEFRAKRSQLISAILDRDESMAVLAATRNAQRAAEWLLEGVPDQASIGVAASQSAWQPMLNTLSSDVPQVQG